MTINELAEKLREMYLLKHANKGAMILLFGVIYGEIMKDEDIKYIEVVKAAGLADSYEREIYKGAKLAEYVDVREEYKWLCE